MRGKPTQEAPPPPQEPPNKPEPVSSAPPTQASSGGDSSALKKEVEWLNAKVEELQEEVKRQAKVIRGKG